jgi:hypothetical protein
MALQKLPVYVNYYPDGRATLTCAHCAVDAELEGAVPTALYAEEGEDRRAIVWESTLTAEHLLAAAAHQCMHLAAYAEAEP